MLLLLFWFVWGVEWGPGGVDFINCARGNWIGVFVFVW